jgi:hypothetical protein
VSRRGGEAGRDKDGVAGFMGSEGIRRGWGGADEMRWLRFELGTDGTKRDGEARFIFFPSFSSASSSFSVCLSFYFYF